MNRSIGLIAAVLALGCFSPLRAEGSCHGWDGLWRVIPVDKSQGQALHLVLSESEDACQVVYYEYDFSRATEVRDLKLSSEQLEFSSSPAGRPFRISLLRDHSSLSGKLEFVHPQFRAVYERAGHRVTSNGSWSPVTTVQSAADELGIADLSLFLVDKAPKGSLAEFEEFWDREIEPTYYAVVQDVVYGPEGGLEERREHLSRILNLLRDEAFCQRTRQFHSDEIEAISAIKEKAPGLFFPNLFVSMPALERFSLTVLPFERIFLVRIGIDSPELLNSGSLKGWFIREHLKLPLYQMFSPVDPSLAAAVIRDGFACQWAVSYGLVAGPLDCFLSGSRDAAVPVPTRDARKDLHDRIASRIGNTEAHQADILVGMEFAQRVNSSFQLPEILAMDRKKMADLFWSFLGEPSGSSSTATGVEKEQR